jgi:alpha-beta hydrolase superfamily lysophospholipase
MKEARGMQLELEGSEGRISVRVWEHPGARRLVVISHGYGEHIERYDHVARALRARGAAVYGPDHLGHGLSAGERVLITDVEHVVDDLLQVIERARRDHPALPLVLLGHSMGGLIATRLAQRAGRPRLAGLVLSGPAIGLGPAMAQMAEAGFADLPLDVSALSRDPAVGEAYAADPLVWHGAWKAPTLAALARAQDAVEQGPGLADLPLLWIHGTEDPLVPIILTRPAIERLRGTDFTAHEHEGGRHETFNETDRERAIDVLCAFVERVAP